MVQERPGDYSVEYMPVEEHEAIARLLEKPQLKLLKATSGEPGWWLEAIFGPWSWNVYWHWAYLPSNWLRLHFGRQGWIIGPLTIMAPSNWRKRNARNAR